MNGPITIADSYPKWIVDSAWHCGRTARIELSWFLAHAQSVLSLAYGPTCGVLPLKGRGWSGCV